jgi:hypothetical protein
MAEHAGVFISATTRDLSYRRAVKDGLLIRVTTAHDRESEESTSVPQYRGDCGRRDAVAQKPDPPSRAYTCELTLLESTRSARYPRPGQNQRRYGTARWPHQNVVNHQRGFCIAQRAGVAAQTGEHVGFVLLRGTLLTVIGREFWGVLQQSRQVVEVGGNSRVLQPRWKIVRQQTPMTVRANQIEDGRC